MPACDLTSSPSAQKVIPSPYAQAATLSPADQLGALIDVSEEFRAESTLADPGLADERHELDCRVARAPVEEALQQRLLDVAADEHTLVRPDQVGAEPSSRLDRAVQTQRLALPLSVRRRQWLVGEHALGLAERLLGNRHLVNGCGRLDASRRVDDVPGDDPLTELGSRLQGNDRRTGVDPDPHLKLELRLTFVELGDRLDAPQSRPDRPLGVVLVRNRRARTPPSRRRR